MRTARILLAAGVLLGTAGCATATTSGGPPSPSLPSPSVPITSAPVTPPAAPSVTRTTDRPTPTRPQPTRGTPTPTRTGSEQVLAQLEVAAETAAEVAVAEALATAGITLATGPDCTADLTLDTSGRSASGVVTCTGTTTQGLKVKATLTGSFAAGSCEGRLVVTVAGRTVVDEAVTECPVP